MSRRGGGCLTAVAIALGAALVVLGAGLVWLVGSGGTPQAPAPDGREQLVPREFQDYTWTELSQVAALVAAADSDDEAAEVAETYNVSVGATRSLKLDDGTVVSLVVVGLCHDERADGGGKAGLTLMTSPIALRPMNESGTSDGGWEASEVRTWLATDGVGLLPDDLASAVVPVHKLTNNAGVTSDASSVTQTSDNLWLFSAAEVCGRVGWFESEYGSEPNAYTGYIDFAPYDELLSSEGTQYAYFADAGVTDSSDPSHALQLTYAGQDVAWWYRSAYPFSYTGEDAAYFYQVMSTGFPGTTGLAGEPAGVVVGLCL